MSEILYNTGQLHPADISWTDLFVADLQEQMKTSPPHCPWIIPFSLAIKRLLPHWSN